MGYRTREAGDAGGNIGNLTEKKLRREASHTDFYDEENRAWGSYDDGDVQQQHTKIRAVVH